MKKHVSNEASKAISRCLAIKRLYGIKPKAIWQLYSSVVTSISDYVASTWYKSKASYPLFDQVQRLGGQAITKAFRSASLPILEAEARIYLVEIHLRLRILKQIVNLHTTPHSHPFWKCRYRAAKQQKRFFSPLARFLQEFEPELNKKHRQPIETIIPFAIPSHHQLTNYEITITRNRSSAKAEAKLFDNKITFFTNGSDWNEMVGAAAIQRGRQELKVEKMSQMCNSSVLNSYLAELFGIHLALKRICQQQLRPR